MAAILIMDNHPASRMLLAAVLTSAKHIVTETFDGIEALTKIRAMDYDIVFCDPFLTNKSGHEFIRQLRNDPFLKSVPVVFWIAAQDIPEAQCLARTHGVTHLLSKRSKPGEILQLLVTMLGEALAGYVPETEFNHSFVHLITERLLEAMSTRDTPPSQPLYPPDEHARQHQARPILVVEDNPMDVDFMLQAFKESNVANPVNVCRDGEEALQYIEAHQTPEDPNLPLLVLLDLRLPKVDGIDVLRQARQHSVWRQVPFIVVTTSRENIDITTAYDLSVNSYIVKPVNFPAFAEVVKHIRVYWLLTNEPPFPEPCRRPS